MPFPRIPRRRQWLYFLALLYFLAFLYISTTTTQVGSSSTFFPVPTAIPNPTGPPAAIPYTNFRQPLYNKSYYWKAVLPLEGFWNGIHPGFRCPPGLLKRVGKTGNGGKWVCGFQNLGALANCTVYSFGVKDDSSFEMDVLKISPRCRVFAYDPSVNKMGRPLSGGAPRVQFRRMGITGHANDNDNATFKTLKTLMTLNGHEWIDILKVDVEGAEYESLERIMKDFAGDILPFGQLLLEVHWSPGYYRGKKGVDVLATLEKLEERGLRMFFKEYNDLSDPQGCCSELSFINTNSQLAMQTFFNETINSS